MIFLNSLGFEPWVAMSPFCPPPGIVVPEFLINLAADDVDVDGFATLLVGSLSLVPLGRS
jgi:hypothetical protein